MHLIYCGNDNDIALNVLHWHVGSDFRLNEKIFRSLRDYHLTEMFEKSWLL